MFYIRHCKHTADTISFLAPDFVLSVTVFSFLRYATRSPFIFLRTLSLSASSSMSYTHSTCFFKLRFLYAPLFTFHNPISARYNYVNCRQNALFEFILDTSKEKNMRTVTEISLNCGHVAKQNRKLIHTRCKLLHDLLFAPKNKNKIKVFEFFTTLQEQSNHTTHDQIICTAAYVAQIVRTCFGDLKDKS